MLFRSKANVQEVFISIPNFDQLLIEKSIQVINSQHIFYCGIDYITYMFSLFNYRCNVQLSCGEHLKSNMFHFVLDPTLSSTSIPQMDTTLYKEIYVNKIQKIKEQIEQAVLATEAFIKQANGAAAKKVIVVPGRLINIVA